MQTIICASKYRFNVLGQHRQTQHTIIYNSNHGHNGHNNDHNNDHNDNSYKSDTNGARYIFTGPFHIIT